MPSDLREQITTPQASGNPGGLHLFGNLFIFQSHSFSH